MIPRSLQPRVLEALADRPVVVVNGARQTGKTSLVTNLAQTAHPAEYLSLDDITTLSLAAADPIGFIAARTGPVVIDEIQRLPELMLAIKHSVDADRRPGRFLLTGSANVLTLPRLADSLAGRMEIETLWPLAQSEIEGGPGDFIERLLSLEQPEPITGTENRGSLARRIVRGGYPEPIAMSETRRPSWMDAYLTSVLQKDVRELADVAALTVFPRLLQAVGARTSSALNLSDLSRILGVPWSTLGRYYSLLKATFAVTELPAWSGSEAKRVARSPKAYLADTGMLAHLVRAGVARLEQEPEMFGRALESFAVMEVVKQASWSAPRITVSHFARHQIAEVDVVLEGADGSVAGIEVKAAVSLGPSDFKGLRMLADEVGSRFTRGVVLYTGNKTVRVSAPPVELLAMPVESLWADPSRHA